MNKYILLFRFLIAGSLAFSQNYVDVLKVSANTTQYNTFDSSNTKTRLNELTVDLTVPVKINEGFSLLTGVIYEDIQTKLFADGITKNFGSTSVKLGFNKQLSEKWSTTVVALPKIS